jgi:uncharacterized membrane protein
MELLPTFLLLALALGGLALAVYFTLIYYRLIPPDSGSMPRFCRLGEGTCGSVVFSRYGRVFGFPNSLLGLVFYLGLGGVAVSRLVSGTYAALDLLLAAAVASLLLAAYLVYSLFVKLRTPCPL